MQSGGLKDEEEVVLRAAAVWRDASGQDNFDAVKLAFSGSRVGYGDFRRKIVILKTILERL
jgi:hypothetical protein